LIWVLKRNLRIPFGNINNMNFFFFFKILLQKFFFFWSDWNLKCILLILKKSSLNLNLVILFTNIIVFLNFFFFFFFFFFFASREGINKFLSSFLVMVHMSELPQIKINSCVIHNRENPPPGGTIFSIMNKNFYKSIKMKTNIN